MKSKFWLILGASASLGCLPAGGGADSASADLAKAERVEEATMQSSVEVEPQARRKTCRKEKARGDSCISRTKNCHRPLTAPAMDKPQRERVFSSHNPADRPVIREPAAPIRMTGGYAR